MKYSRLFLVLALIFIFFISASSAFENNIGGNSKNAGMGFAQVASNRGLLSNPASFSDKMLQLSMTRSELYEIGLFYNYWEGSIRLSNSLRAGFGYEFVTDEDPIDNSGFGQELFVMGVAFKLIDNLQVGVNLSKNVFKLLDEEIGNGYACDIGVLAGPFMFGSLKLTTGLEYKNVYARRDYESGRVEKPERELLLGLNAKCGKLSAAMDLQQEDFRLGVEYQLLSSLALRAGMMDGQPTLGLGISLGKFEIDYAFWLSELEATHRICSVLSF